MKIITSIIAATAFFLSSIALAAPVNINTASATEIAEALNGIGISKAEALVAYRTANGNFASAEQIVNVKGIGQAIFEKNKADILTK